MTLAVLLNDATLKHAAFEPNGVSLKTSKWEAKAPTHRSRARASRLRFKDEITMRLGQGGLNAYDRFQ
jgi:hypothetical protein